MTQGTKGSKRKDGTRVRRITVKRARPVPKLAHKPVDAGAGLELAIAAAESALSRLACEFCEGLVRSGVLKARPES